MKRIKKCEIKFDDGWLVTKDDEVIALPYDIARQFDMLDEAVQMVRHLEGQPPAAPTPNLDGFERLTLSHKRTKFTCDTPALDTAEATAKAMLQDIKHKQQADDANLLCEKFKDLIEFCASDYIFEQNSYPVKYDWYIWGNPLEVSADEVEDILLNLAESPFVKIENIKRVFGELEF